MPLAAPTAPAARRLSLPQLPALPRPRLAVAVFSLVNYFAFTGYTPRYDEQVSKRDFRIQAVFTVIALPVVAGFVYFNLKETINVPIVSVTQSGISAPGDVAGYFAKQATSTADTAYRAVTCPCSKTSARLSDVANVSALEDSYCAELRKSTDLQGDGRALQDLLRMINDEGNSNCVADTGAFHSAIAALASDKSLFPLDDQFENRTMEFASNLQEALCGLAFGLVPPSGYFPNPKAGASFPRSGAVPSRVTQFENECHSGNDEVPFFVSSPFDYSFTEANIVQLQASRLNIFLSATIETCEKLFVLREGFLRTTVNDVKLVTPTALAPEELRREVEGLWRQALRQASLPTSAFVPGLSPSDKLAAVTDVLNPMELNPMELIADFYTLLPPATIPLDTFPFSSRLPFVRADFIKEGLKFFYFLARIPSPEGQIFPVLAGQARVIAAVDANTSIPIFQAEGRLGHSTPGWEYNSTWAPLGDDLISLLDACAQGRNISVDVHNLRPIVIEDPVLANRSSYGATMSAFNYSAACSVGDAPSDLGDRPQPVLFNVPLKCPPLLVWLGQLRANSTYFNRTSPARPLITDFPDLSNDTVKGIEAAVLKGDLSDRAALLSDLFFVDGNSVAFNVSTEAHYALCAPAVCSYTMVEEPTTIRIVLGALADYGGTASSIVMLLGSAVLYISFIAYQLKRRRARRRAAAEAAAAAAAAQQQRSAENPMAAVVVSARREDKSWK